MADIEKVIEGLECCNKYFMGKTCHECPYSASDDCEALLTYDAIELLKKQRKKPPIHIHEEYQEHDWVLNEDGEVDMFAHEREFHIGPSCKRCYHSFCIHCDPEGWNKALPCIVDYYTCPGCQKRITKNEKFCSKCGQEIDWS